MAIVDTLGMCEFRDRIRMIRPDNFSYEALGALYEYYESLSDDIGENIEFDPIAICCEWTEYDDLEELKSEYKDIEELEDMGCYTIELDNGGILVQHG